MNPPRTQRSMYLTGPERVELREVEVPEPGEGEILLEIEAATTCGTDVKVFRRGGHPRMLKVPGPFGHEMAGTVAAVGRGVTGLQVGDRVVAANSAPCGTCEYCRRGRENLCTDLHYLNGAFAEFLLVPRRFVERNTHRIPEGLSFGLAALTEPLACVLHGVDCCELGPFLPGEKVGHSGIPACDPRTAGGSRPAGGSPSAADPRVAGGSPSAGRSRAAWASHRAGPWVSDGEPVDIAVYGGGPIGLLFVGVLALGGHRVILADLSPERLEAGLALGASGTVGLVPGGGMAEKVRGHARRAEGFDVAIDATGVPEVWADVIASVRPGGLANLFGGCAPGTTVPLHTHAVHYSELTVKGVYHHRPATVARALDLLASGRMNAKVLLSAERPLEELEDALRSMMRQEALKVVITP